MPRRVKRNPLQDEKRDAVISQMLKHLRNELPPSLHQKVSAQIACCESCQLLYAEIKDFFNPVNRDIAETLYPDHIERNRAFLREITSTSTVSLRPKKNTTRQSLFRAITVEEFEDDCFCCGS
mgnify:FL=1